jgi:sugar/nucleoside kinase (ribokinase family)
MPKDVSVVGPLNIDLLISGDGPPDWESLPWWDGPADMEITAAGSVGYTVQNLARLGLHVRVSSCLPDDPLGLFIQDTLQRAGVDTGIVRTQAGTVGGIGVYMLLFGSRKRPLVYRMPTHELWPTTFSAAEIETLLDARWLHCGGYLHHRDAWHGATRDLFIEAKRRGLYTSIDTQFPLFAMEPPWITALDDVLPSVDVLFCDEGEARQISDCDDLDQAAQTMLSAGAGTVIIKQGAAGATAYRAGGQHHQDAVIIGALVDSIGAGDTFDAGVICGLLEDWPLEQCMRFASTAAGFTVTGIGGTQTMPDHETIMARLRG